jgi:hypothetical protein
VSHYTTLVIFPKEMRPATEKEATTYLDKVLAPFDENGEQAPYPKPCYCVGKAAERAVEELATQQFGTIDDLRASFSPPHPKPVDADDDTFFAWFNDKTVKRENDAAWKQHIEERCQFELEHLAAHPGKSAPMPDCDTCQGTGLYQSTYPRDVWSWRTIEGKEVARTLDDDALPESVTIDGTQLVKCLIGGAKWDWWVIGGRWNGEATENGRNLFPMTDLRQGWSAFAILTPDGIWHAEAEMGYWAMTRNEDDQWDKRQYEIASAFPEHWAAWLDLHI